MNKHIVTSFEVENMPDTRRESVIATAFASLLPILAAYIRAERALEDVGFCLDPAYAQWHHDSEEAQDRLIDVLHVLRTAPLGIAMDASLRRMALLIHAMRDDPEHARNLCQKMEVEFATRFRVPGRGAMADHRNLLLAWCRPLVADFASLPLFDTDPQDEDESGQTPSP